MMKQLLYLTLLVYLLMVAPGLLAKNILFLSYDCGDANNFKILIENLPKNNNYKVIAIGKAKDLFSDNVLNKADCLENFDNNQFIQSRAKILSTRNLSCLKNTLFASDFKLDVVITGMSSAVLAQIMHIYPDVDKIAYFDNLDPYVGDNDPAYYTYRFVQAIKNNTDIDHLSLFIPNGVIKNSFIRKFGNGQFPSSKITIVGSPALSLWQSEASQAVGCPTRTALFKRLNINVSKKHVVFAGDTTIDYKASFIQFVNIMNQLPDYEAIVTYHPKTEGEIEKNAVKRYNRADNMVVVDPNDFSTYCLAKLSHVFIVHKSSMGTQALSIPKKVIFIAQNYHNIAIDHKLAVKVYQVKDAVSAIIKAYNSKLYSSNFYSYYEMPKDSISTFINKIDKQTQ